LIYVGYYEVLSLFQGCPEPDLTTLKKQYRILTFTLTRISDPVGFDPDPTFYKNRIRPNLKLIRLIQVFFISINVNAFDVLALSCSKSTKRKV